MLSKRPSTKYWKYILFWKKGNLCTQLSVQDVSGYRQSINNQNICRFILSIKQVTNNFSTISALLNIDRQHQIAEMTGTEKEYHVQFLCRVLIWPEKPQLIDLISFAKMCWHDLVPFFYPTSKHSDVSHNSSVMVKIWVKHQGFKWVINACHWPENTNREKKSERLIFWCQKCFTWEMKPP